jgi:hypothetical protein
MDKSHILLMIDADKSIYSHLKRKKTDVQIFLLKICINLYFYRKFKTLQHVKGKST